MFRTRSILIATALAVMAAATVAAAAPAAETAAAPPAPAAEALDVTRMNEVRERVAPQVCLVTVEGPLGLPVARASGFLMGDGGFVITDLASLAQPGVRKATVKFPDGTEAVATQFGMADPALGLVAIKVDLPAKRSGLKVGKPVIGDDGLPAAAIGWQWGEQQAVAMGQLKGVTPAADLAAQLGLKAPLKTDIAMTAFLSSRCELACGSPIVDATGTVVGVLHSLVGADRQVAAPADEVRKALLAAGTALRPFSQLPAYYWPVAVEMLPGRPFKAPQFAAMVRQVKMKSVCGKCKGPGIVTVRKLVGTQKVLNMVRPIYREEQETCDQCKGEGVLCERGMYKCFQTMAEGATWLLTARDTPDSVRKAACENGMGLLEAIGKVKGIYRGNLVGQGGEDLNALVPVFPRGAVVYALVKETVDLRGDRYTVLLPEGGRRPILVTADALSAEFGPADGGAARRPASGQGIVIGGILEGTVRIQGKDLVFMRPFGWAWGPVLSPDRPWLALASEAAPAETVAVASAAPAVPATPATPAATPPETPAAVEPPPAAEDAAQRRPAVPPRPKRERKPGEPSFFGL